MGNKIKNKKKVKYSFIGTAFMLFLSVIVTYVYFYNPTVLTFSSQKSLPIYRVDTEEKKVAITFDVNWGKDYTMQILDILDKYDSKASFFLIGKWIDYSKENVDLVKEMNKRGHEVANHSNIHPDFTNIDRDRIVRELEITDSKIYEITNKRSKLFRFPKGEYNQNSVEIVKSLGYIPIQWDVDSIDWKEDGLESEYQRVKNKLQAGSIALFHTNAKNTPENLERILKEFKDQGYEFVTLSELLYRENYEIDNMGVQKQLKNIT
ncbi:polysaccharide deacetylase family protein [Candidatus Arthromitus sp. SFB-mouse-Japan]|uniref:polysaccharide deacetylase family protein n=1 Tax=unclassified Candidatus Neoarthromitus TaxID=2638829 RepID=UPI00021B7F73|nr:MULTISPECIES: polysaccharide deacetylase family protein [unclassified Candidatus Arthromitus]EIA25182.1 Putative xylanase/chitin deacetylase [Candidatus Arthromitus sp. SFB-1]EIA26112.1 Putative xylanase/chitin deacetylase [Candidatus Arthromitus sp. SFB-3]EIA26900.1 Putative xylanase/chitin deacetylase [Candidatus Arthromitus sp. SFB-4]EIA27547.1 Putative xylanase/chitin deacetylase [Candidatus Arthromitus sp. SFB-co]EIA31097.1 Putative xylanase/chitin deacetylase [Candidatus Arthromitus s